MMAGSPREFWGAEVDPAQRTWLFSGFVWARERFGQRQLLLARCVAGL
jgi:hypothetical protein